MSHLTDIGFKFQDPAEFLEFVEKIANLDENAAFISPNGYYKLWSPGNGIEFWIIGNSELQLSGCSLHFHGESRMRVHVTQTYPVADSPMRGTLYGWLNPSDDGNPYSGEFPVALAVPNFDYVDEALLLNPMVTVQVAAFAEKELRCYDSDDAFWEAEDSSAGPAEQFKPVWAGNPEADPEPAARIGGHILSFEILNNPITEASFCRMLVQTVGGTVDLVADPDVIHGAPIVGGVVRGEVWLSARVISELPRPVVFARATSAFRSKREARSRKVQSDAIAPVAE